MTPLAPENLVHSLQWRYATKRFDSNKTIPTATWDALEQALVLAPSSFGLQPWKFIVVNDPATRQALVPQSWGQTQPVDCSHFVVFAARTALSEADVDHYIQRIVEVRGGTREALGSFRDMMVNSAKSKSSEELNNWSIRQVYIALGQFMASAAVLGIDACPMEGLVPAEYDKILSLVGTGYHTVVACAAGYRSTDDKYASLAKVRFPLSEVVRRV